MTIDNSENLATPDIEIKVEQGDIVPSVVSLIKEFYSL